MNDIAMYVIIVVVIVALVLGIADSVDTRRHKRYMDSMQQEIDIANKLREGLEGTYPPKPGLINIGSWEVWDTHKPFGPDNPKETRWFHDLND